jgi:hypothetical protein
MGDQWRKPTNRFGSEVSLLVSNLPEENLRAQFWIDLFNALNSRNFGNPSGVASSLGFLSEGATDGGNRRIRFGARLVF